MNKYWQEKGNPDLTNKSKALSRPTEDEKLHLQTPAFTEAISIVPDQDFRLAYSTNRNIAGVAFSYFGVKLSLQSAIAITSAANRKQKKLPLLLIHLKTRFIVCKSTSVFQRPLLARNKFLDEFVPVQNCYIEARVAGFQEVLYHQLYLLEYYQTETNHLVASSSSKSCNTNFTCRNDFGSVPLLKIIIWTHFLLQLKALHLVELTCFGAAREH
jgi:hypothetical protein